MKKGIGEKLLATDETQIFNRGIHEPPECICRKKNTEIILQEKTEVTCRNNAQKAHRYISTTDGHGFSNRERHEICFYTNYTN
jgi:hypothetical protein